MADRVSQEAIEALGSGTPNAIVSQEAVEVLGNTPGVHVSQETVEVVSDGAPANARVTQNVIEAVSDGAAAHARVTQNVLETVSDGAPAHARLTQVVIEVVAGAPALRVTQAGAEVVTATNPAARVTQSGAEVVSLSNPAAYVTQAAAEVVIVVKSGTRSIPLKAAFTATLSRSIPLLASLYVGRLIPLKASFSGGGQPTRSIPLQAAFSGRLEHSVPLKVAVQITRSRSIPLSAAVGNFRLIPFKMSTVWRPSRSIPLLACIGVARSSRSIPLKVAIKTTTNTRSIPLLACIGVAQRQRSVPLKVAIKTTTNTRSIPLLAEIGYTRKIPLKVAIKTTTNTRSVPLLATFSTPGRIPLYASFFQATNFIIRSSNLTRALSRASHLVGGAWGPDSVTGYPIAANAPNPSGWNQQYPRYNDRFWPWARIYGTSPYIPWPFGNGTQDIYFDGWGPNSASGDIAYGPSYGPSPYVAPWNEIIMYRHNFGLPANDPILLKHLTGQVQAEMIGFLPYILSMQLNGWDLPVSATGIPGSIGPGVAGSGAYIQTWDIPSNYFVPGNNVLVAQGTSYIDSNIPGRTFGFEMYVTYHPTIPGSSNVFVGVFG